ncbi:MAG: strictosidine synthase [Chitinophagaceae bacterium]|nr:strictosidine synthase [Chitinophagaceae bacterium]
MNKISLAFLSIVSILKGASAQNTNAVKVATNVKSEKHLSSSVLLWMLTDKPRQSSMGHWKGSHAQIIASNPGLWQYRQIHFAENNPGLWQPIKGVETTIPQNRKVDGVADVTLKSFFSALQGKKQHKLAFADEINFLKRSILYVAYPKKSQWYNAAGDDTKIEARSMVFFRQKEGVSDNEFEKFINNELTPTLANTNMLKELRNKVYNPWKQKQWLTPNVLHDNGKADQFQASLILGFANKSEMENFFNSEEIKKLSERIAVFCSAVHAYEIAETITFVKDGKHIKFN